MNERIRELAKQAGNLDMIDKVWGDGGPPIEYVVIEGDSMYSFTYLEKFAELIVRECLNQCYYRGMNDELYAGQLKAAAYIEQHFGVEE